MENNFESSLKKLQEIVEKLESEDISIDESIKLYEEGLNLSKYLNLQLAKYDEKLESLSSINDEQ